MGTKMRPGDVFGVYVEENLTFFARAEEILPDVKRGWRTLRFTILNPAVTDRETVWILQPSQIDGEGFTMNGTALRLERLPDPAPKEAVEKTENEPEKPRGSASVIAFPGSKDKH